MSAMLVQLSDEQIEQIADRVFAQLDKSRGYNRPLTLTEAAKRLGVSTATVSRRIAAGKIRTVEGIGCPRISEEEIRRLIEGA